MPKTNFPKFDGTNPKIWKEKAEKYFHMFNVPDEYMVDYATLHFTGTVALWLQTYEAQHNIDNWVHLCVAVCQKFGRDLYFSQMSQTLDIKQTSDVDSYYKEFEQLQHQLLTHNHTLDDTFFAAIFLKGLRKEIHLAIILHKPRPVDAALTLALLQEAQLAKNKGSKYEYKRWHNTAGAGKLGTHPVEVVTNANSNKQSEAQNTTAKFLALKAQRRARGECFKCGGKFEPGHRCPKQVSLLVLEELCAALDMPQEEPDKAQETLSDTSSEDTPEQAMSISAENYETARVCGCTASFDTHSFRQFC